MSDIRNPLMAHLSSFRPSDRIELEHTLVDAATRASAISAIKDFIEEWERADWLEAYSIERIGKWLGKTQATTIVEELLDWSLQSQHEARKAFAAGLLIGRPSLELVPD